MGSETDRELRDILDPIVTGFLSSLQGGKEGGAWRPFAQKIYQNSTISPHLPMFDQFAIIGLAPSITGRNASVFRVMRVRLDIPAHTGLTPFSIFGTLNLVCESEPGVPSEKGEWGVCPNSWRPYKETDRAIT